MGRNKKDVTRDKFLTARLTSDEMQVLETVMNKLKVILGRANRSSALSYIIREFSKLKIKKEI